VTLALAGSAGGQNNEVKPRGADAITYGTQIAKAESQRIDNRYELINVTIHVRRMVTKPEGRPSSGEIARSCIPRKDSDSEGINLTAIVKKYQKANQGDVLNRQ